MNIVIGPRYRGNLKTAVMNQKKIIPMRQNLIATVLTVVALAMSVPSDALGQASEKQSRPNKLQSTMGSDEKLGQELAGLYKTYREARKRGDIETMSRIVGDEWTVTNASGQIVTPSPADVKSGRFKDDIIPTIDNITARAYGDVAVLTFRSKSQVGDLQNL